MDALGDDRRLARENSGQYERVDVAGVVEDEHRPAAWNAVNALGHERNPHRRKRPTAYPPEGGPTPLDMRKDKDGERSNDERGGKHNPPSARIENLAREPCALLTADGLSRHFYKLRAVHELSA